MKLYTKLFTKQLTSFQNKTNKKAGALTFCGLALALLFSLLTVSCTKKTRNIVIWTDLPEFASYAELFNSTHTDQKAVVIYKEEPANSLPPEKNELVPDIVVGSWLKNSRTRKYFSPLDYLFTEQKINRSQFYGQLIDYGLMNDKQYLIPVSFNLPMMVFASSNEELVPTSHLLNLEEIEASSSAFNARNKSGEFISMGYAPSWDKDFRYEATKLEGASYQEKGNNFSWNNDAMENTVSTFRTWTAENNTSTAAEENFQYKYLYVPKQKQLSSGRCLYTFMTSGDFFSLSSEQTSTLSFRWLSANNKICVEDDLITMGLYKHARNSKDAEVFIQWFNKEETQNKMMERAEAMQLDSTSFGIAGGFSALQNVNEKIFPVYYRQLLENLPAQDYLQLPNILPYTWPRIKNVVIFPYLQENSNSEVTEESTVKSVSDRIADWDKQYF